MLVLKWKEGAFIEKVNSRWFCWFPAAILVHQNGAPIWRLHTKLYKGVWNVSANNSEPVGHKDLRLGQIVYILVFYNISVSWLLPLDGFQLKLKFLFFVAWQWKQSIGHLFNITWCCYTADHTTVCLWNQYGCPDPTIEGFRCLARLSLGCY